MDDFSISHINIERIPANPNSLLSYKNNFDREISVIGFSNAEATGIVGFNAWSWLGNKENDGMV